MTILNWFIKVTKGEPIPKKKNNKSIDEGKYFSAEEVKKLKTFCIKIRRYAVAKKKFTPVRNAFMVELGLNAGLRVEEMASLKHKNLVIDEEKSSIVLIGKGNKERTVWINSKFKENCQTYIACKKQFSYSIGDNSFLLNNLKGEKISKRALQKFFKKILEKAGLPVRYHIHCLRHTYSTFFLSASNNNYRYLQDQLGHESIKTTQRYAGIIKTEIKKAIENLYR